MTSSLFKPFSQTYYHSPAIFPWIAILRVCKVEGLETTNEFRWRTVRTLVSKAKVFGDLKGLQSHTKDCHAACHVPCPDCGNSFEDENSMQQHALELMALKVSPFCLFYV
jgi:hypothetical protein